MADASRVRSWCGLAVAVAIGACGGPPATPAITPRPAPIVAPAATVAASPALGPLDREAIRTLTITRGFRLGAPVAMTPTPDGKAVLFLRSTARAGKQSLYETDLATGKTTLALSPDALVAGTETLSPEERARRERLRIAASGFTGFELTADGTRALLTLSGRLFVFTRGTGAVHELALPEGSAAFDPHLSPDGDLVAYVRDHDVRAMPLDPRGDAERTITRGGTALQPHGEAEFVAQEELDRTRGFWWSPRGDSILFEEYDASKVEALTIADPAHPERPADVARYPRAGTANADVRLGLAPVPEATTTKVNKPGGGLKTTAAAATKTQWIEWDRAKYPYVVDVRWPRLGPPTVYVMSRDQRDGALLAITPSSGKTRILLTEHDDAWLEHDPEVPRFVTGSEFVWSAVRDDVWRLELRRLDGTPARPLTPGDLHYHALLDVDPKRNVARFLASWQPTESQLFEVALGAGSGTPPRALTAATAFVQRASFSDDHRVWAMATSGLDGQRAFVARGVGDDAVETTIPSVAEAPPPLRPVEIARVGAEATRVAVVRPHAFDPKRKYRVIDAAYGGPGVNVVTLDGLTYVRMQWLADACDAIVVAIDAPGTPHRGRAWERAIGKAFGRVPVEGHVTALRALAATHPELDLGDVAVYGWSFGGYFSAMAVLRRPDVYRAAVVIAPVADFRDYDTTYTERYMGLPSADAAAYDDASLLTWARRPISADAPARPMLVMHGTADDNVYFLHSLKLVDALEASGRPFAFVPLQGQTHQVASVEMAEVLWTRAVEALRASP